MDEERDVYDSMLTRDEIQGAVGDINTLVKKEAADARSECRKELEILKCWFILATAELLYV